MADFSDSERQASVEQLVPTSLTRTVNDLGFRETGVTFTSLQAAAATLYIRSRDALFYTVQLSAERLREAVAAEYEVLEDLMETMEAVGYRNSPVSSLTSLSNAKAALDAMATSLGTRVGVFDDVLKVPAFTRFERNTNQFLEAYGGNVKKGGQIIRTVQEAKERIPLLLTELRERHSEVQARAEKLRDARSTFEGVNLPKALAEQVLSNASSVVGGVLEEMELRTPITRLAVLRSSVLDLLSTKAAVKAYSSAPNLGLFHEIEGGGGAYSSSSLLANPATLAANVTGPYSLLEGYTTLDFFMDRVVSDRITATADSVAAGSSSNTLSLTYATGGLLAAGVAIGDVLYLSSGADAGSRWVVQNRTDTTIDAVGAFIPTGAVGVGFRVLPPPDESITLLESQVLTIDGLVDESYTTSSGAKELSFSVGGVTLNVTLSVSTLSADDVASEINAAVTSENLLAESFYPNAKLIDGVVNITSTGPTTADFELVVGSFDPLGVEVGDLIVVSTGPNAGTTWTVSAIGGSGNNTVSASGSGLATNDTNALVDAVTGSKRVRLRFADAEVALTNKQSLSVLPVADDAYTILGLVENFTITARPTTAQQVVDALNLSASTVLASVVKVDGSEYYTRTNIDDAFKLSFYKISDRVNATTVAGTSVTFSFTGAATAGVTTGDVVVVREAALQGEVEEWGVVTSVDDSQVTATMNNAITDTTNILVDVGPDLSALLPIGQYARFDEGVNEGQETEIVAIQDVPLDATVASIPTTTFTRGAGVSALTTLVAHTVSFASEDTTTDSRVQVEGSAKDRFFFLASSVNTGTTNFVQLPEIPSSLAAGDKFEYYPSQYNSPSLSIVIEDIISEESAIQLETAIPSTLSGLTFSTSSEIPFARIRRRDRADFDTLQENLESWAELSVNQPTYFRELERLSNFLLDTNPTASEIGTAQAHLQTLQGVLTEAGATATAQPTASSLEGITSAYVATSDRDVDALLTALREKGADRAVEVLLECKFDDFFNLSEDSSSYLGEMNVAMKEVVRNDLPIRKTDRFDAENDRLLEESEDIDYEFDFSDVEDQDIPNIPGTRLRS